MMNWAQVEAISVKSNDTERDLAANYWRVMSQPMSG